MHQKRFPNARKFERSVRQNPEIKLEERRKTFLKYDKIKYLYLESKRNR